MSDATPRRSVLDLSPSEWIVLVFNGLYLAPAVIASVRLDNAEFLLYFVVVCLLLLAVLAVHMRVRLHIGALWGLSLWGLAHMAGGLVHVPESWPTLGGNILYNLWIVPGLLKYDQVVHALGFGLVTWICWQGLRWAFRRRGVEVTPTVGLLTLCVAGGMGFGAANEVVEFIAMLLLPRTNVGGYENTGWDLVANSVGAVVAAVAISVSETCGVVATEDDAA